MTTASTRSCSQRSWNTWSARATRSPSALVCCGRVATSFSRPRSRGLSMRSRGTSTASRLTVCGMSPNKRASRSWSYAHSRESGRRSRCIFRMRCCAIAAARRSSSTTWQSRRSAWRGRLTVWIARRCSAGITCWSRECRAKDADVNLAPMASVTRDEARTYYEDFSLAVGIRDWLVTNPRHEQLRILMDEILTARRGLRILDVGCGAGVMTNHLRRYGDVTGVDFSGAAIAAARVFTARRFGRRPTFHAGSLEALPNDASFDV